MRILRSIAAVIFGMLALGIAVPLANDILIHTVPQLYAKVGVPAGTDLHPSLGWFLLRLIIFGSIMAAGGYLAAVIAGRAEMKHVGFISVLMLLQVMVHIDPLSENAPTWSDVGMRLAMIFMVLPGGFLRVWQKRVRGEVRPPRSPAWLMLESVLWGAGLATLIGAAVFPLQPVFHRPVGMDLSSAILRILQTLCLGAVAGLVAGGWRMWRRRKAVSGTTLSEQGA